VEHSEVVRQFFQPFGEAFFSDRAALPGFGALRVVRQGEDEPAELRVVGADALLACVLAALVLSTG
jgi:hypothetical protein